VETSAWEWNEKRKQFYYHAFYKEQPDLNLRNKDVLQELEVNLGEILVNTLKKLFFTNASTNKIRHLLLNNLALMSSRIST